MKAQNSDFLQKIDVEHFLNVLGVEFEPSRGGLEVNFHCPFPGHQNGDQNASAYMNKKTTAWFCHGCHKRGNAITFAADMKQITPLLSLQFLREKYDPGYFEAGPTSTEDEVRRILTSKQQPKEERQPVLPVDALTRFEVDWITEAHCRGNSSPYAAYMFGRGFDADTLHEWEIGYDPHSDRITIPVRDERNQLIGFKGRTYTDKTPKYLVIGDRPGREPHYGWATYSTGRVVFGLPRAILSSDPYLEDVNRHFIVCEGELNVIALWQAGYTAVALNGSNLTKYQAEVITREADRLTLWFDNDKAGQIAVKETLAQIGNHMPIDVVIADNDAADPDGEDINTVLTRLAVGSTEYLLSSKPA